MEPEVNTYTIHVELSGICKSEAIAFADYFTWLIEASEWLKANPQGVYFIETAHVKDVR